MSEAPTEERSTSQTDQRQSLRMRRFAMGAIGYVVGFLISALCYLAGLMAPEPILYALPVVLALNGLMFAAFVSGVNLRMRDPSLTMPQLLLATAVMMYGAAVSDDTRALFLLLYPVPFLFGAFRLPVRQHLWVAAFALLCHGLVVAQAVYLRPQQVRLGLEVLAWLTMAIVLTWMVVIGHQLRRARSQAQLDALTGLPNRSAVLANLSREQARRDRGGPPYCVCFIDIDRFKQINDTFGHAVGDVVLQRLSASFVEQLRRIDEVGRYGGDEFLAILPDTTLDQARVTCERVRARVSEIELAGVVDLPRLTVSIGVTQAEVGEQPATLVARADMALYEAKRTGRDRIVLA